MGLCFHNPFWRQGNRSSEGASALETQLGGWATGAVIQVCPAERLSYNTCFSAEQRILGLSLRQGCESNKAIWEDDKDLWNSDKGLWGGDSPLACIQGPLPCGERLWPWGQVREWSCLYPLMLVVCTRSWFCTERGCAHSDDTFFTVLSSKWQCGLNWLKGGIEKRFSF